MALPSLASLQRRSRQVETLRKMLSAVDTMLALVDKIAADRELTSDERDEQQRLAVRRVRLQNSLAEAGG